MDEQVALVFRREDCVLDDDRVIVVMTRGQLKRRLDEIDAQLRDIRPLPDVMRGLQAKVSALPVQGRDC